MVLQWIANGKNLGSSTMTSPKDVLRQYRQRSMPFGVRRFDSCSGRPSLMDPNVRLSVIVRGRQIPVDEHD